MLEATPAFSTPEKFPNQHRQALRLLEVRHMPRTIQHRDSRMRDALRKFIGISRRNNAVGFAPDDQGRRGDAVDVFFRPLSGSGQTNLPVQACDQMKPTWASMRSAVSLGNWKNLSACSPLGSANKAARVFNSSIQAD
jgi:hypothetical protein